jgi:hypothetical protein
MPKLVVSREISHAIGAFDLPREVLVRFLLRLREAESSEPSSRLRDEDDDRCFTLVLAESIGKHRFRFDVTIDDATSPDHLFVVDVRCHRGLAE